MADHAVDFWLMTEDLPNPDNRVTVDPDKRRFASPTKPATRRPATCFTRSSSRCSACLGMHHHLINRSLYMKNDVGVAGVAHQSGTCRFGD